VAATLLVGMIRVLVRDRALARVAEVAEVLTLDASPRWRSVGGWSLRLGESAAADALREPGSGLIVQVDGVTVMSGPTREVRWGPDGTVEAAGFDDLVWLRDRLALTAGSSPFPTTKDYTGFAETVIRELVDENAGPSADVARRVLTLAADQGRGSSGTWKATNQPLFDLVRDIAVGQGWGLQVRWVAGGLVFSVLVPRDVSGSVRLYDSLGAIEGWSRLLVRPDASFVFAAGSESADERPVVSGGSSDVPLWGRVEQWVDARTTDVSGELSESRDERLADAGSVDSVTAQAAAVGSFRFGVDYGLGDTVAVEVGGARRFATVVGVDVDVSTVRPVLSDGRVAPLLPSLGKIADLERRMSRQETS
jgi:hypothetical protein